MRLNIEAERAKAMKTKAALSAELDVSQKTYMNYVLSKTPVPSDILLKMSKMFGCTTDYLLEEK